MMLYNDSITQDSIHLNWTDDTIPVFDVKINKVEQPPCATYGEAKKLINDSHLNGFVK